MSLLPVSMTSVYGSDPRVMVVMYTRPASVRRGDILAVKASGVEDL